MAKYKYILTVIFLLCTLITYAQPAQYTPMTASGYQMKRLKVDSTLHLPSFCGVPNLRGSTVKDGALAIDTCGGYLYMWTNQLGWDTINVTTTGGGTQDLQSVLNNGNTSYNRDINLLGRSSGNQIYISPLDNNWMPFMALGDSIGGGLYQYTYPQATIEFINKNMPQKLKGQDSTRAIIYLPVQTIDATDTLAKLSDLRNVNGDFWKTSGTTLLSGNISIGNDNNITFTGGQTQDIPLFNINANIIQFDGGTYKFKTLSPQTDTTSFKPLGINSDGEIQPLTSWGNGGTTIDTTSLSNRINSKLSISDTSSMLTNYFNKVNYGLSKSGQTIRVDSATLSNKYLRIVDTSNKWVNRITRTLGKDSILYFIDGNRFAIKDSVGSNPAPVGYYGAFQDTIIQTLPLANTAYPIKARITDLSNGIFLADSTRFVFNNAGIYNLQWSGQFQNTNIDVQDARIWVRKNNVDIIGTTGLVAIPKRKTLSEYGHTVTGWNFLLEINAGDTLQFYWASTSTDVSLHYYPVGTVPPSPTTASMVVTITQQSGIMAGTGITGLGTPGNLQSGANQTLATSTTGTDFTITSASNTQTFNLPIASATNTGKLSNTNWSTFNSKLGASDTVSLSNRINLKLNSTDTTVFQRKSISAYSILANKTPATANATAQTFRDTSGVFDGSITWTATTAPSGATNHSYRLTQVGKCVTLNISLVYATNGSATSAILLTLPSNAPTPAQPTGLTGASQYIYVLNVQLATSTNVLATSAATRGMMRNNSANNGVELFASWAGQGISQVNLTIQYWTN